MDQRFRERLVGIGEVDIFPHHGQIDLVDRVLQRIDDFVPQGQVGGSRRQMEFAADDLVEALLV